MGREVRMVPKGWEHPKDDSGSGRYKPLLKCYESSLREFLEVQAADGLQAALDEFGVAPNANDYMPSWPAGEADHFMMYEDTSEGTPISPAFATREELARWLADTGASSFGSSTATYEQWLATIQRGYAIGAVMIAYPGGCGEWMSGVEAAERKED